MIVITTENSRYTGSVFVADTNDKVEALRQFKRACDGYKVTFYYDGYSRRMALAPAGWCWLDPNRFCLNIEIGHVDECGFANAAVQW